MEERTDANAGVGFLKEQNKICNLRVIVWRFEVSSLKGLWDDPLLVFLGLLSIETADTATMFYGGTAHPLTKDISSLARNSDGATILYFFDPAARTTGVRKEIHLNPISQWLSSCVESLHSCSISQQ